MGDLGTEPIFEGSSESGGEGPPAKQPAGKPAARRPDPPPEDVDAGMQSGGEDPSPTQALEAGLKKRKWQGTEMADCHQQGHRAGPVCLGPPVPVRANPGPRRGPRRPSEGQPRGAAPKSAIACVPVGEHRRPEVLLPQWPTHWPCGEEDPGGKGIAGVQRWHTHVAADVLKFETPLAQRQLVAGASDASTRLHRTTSIAECLRQVLKLESEPDLAVHDRILRAVEQCGLNVTGTSPVCHLPH